MTDQHTPPRRLSAEQATAVAPGRDSTDAPAKPSRSRAPKSTATSAAKAVRVSPRITAPDGEAADTTASAASAASPGPNAVPDTAPAPAAAASGPAARPQVAAKVAAPSRAAAQEDTPLPLSIAEPSQSIQPPSKVKGAEAAPSPARRASPAALPDSAPEPDLPTADAGPFEAAEDDGPEAGSAAAPGDDLEADLADPDAGKPDAPASRDDEDEDDDEEEAPRSNARMPGMGGGMARPGMRPISPQLGGRPTPAPRIPSKAENFVEGDHVVYPTHGVGRVERIATEEIAGHKLELIHITFEENRMTLRVPVAKARSAGLRKLATRKMFDEALAVLRGRARIKRTMWSRRAQEYEAKINSGDPLSIAEVVRDLHRNAGQPDQSFSERQIYEAAMDRLAAELAALDQTEKSVAATKLVDYLKTV